MPATPADPIFGEFLDDVDWADSTARNAVSVLNRFAAWCAANDLELLTVNRGDCHAYLRSRTDELGAAAQRDTWKILRAFFAWAARPLAEGGGGEIKASPMEHIKGPKVPTRPATKAAKADDVSALLRAFDSSTSGRRNGAMVSLMYRSGLRVGELPGLNLSDLHTLPGNSGRSVIEIRRTKSGEPRLVPVHPETQRYLDRYLRRRGRAAGPLFLGASHTRDTDGRLTTKAIQLIVTRASRRAGVTVAPHQLRRGFTAQYLRDGGDVLSLEIIGGWADHRMPRRYLADEEAAAAIDRYFDVADGRRRLRSV